MTTGSITKEEKAKWIEDLRSGKYTKVKEVYYTADPNCFCTLGILKFKSVENEDRGEELLEDFCDKKNLFGQITRMNDQLDLSFPEIADWIEKNVHAR